jgi:hypothetical protein
MFKPRKVLIASKVPFNFSSMLCLFLVKKLPDISIHVIRPVRIGHFPPDAAESNIRFKQSSKIQHF